MSLYIDAFVLPVPKKNIAAYTAMSKKAGKVWMEYGALDYVECVGDDLKPAWVEMIFPKLVKAKPSETVVFSFITYKSRAHRDKVGKQVMKDPRIIATMSEKMPFDQKRMSYGGFKSIVNL